MEFFTGVLVGYGGANNEPLKALDVFSYGSQAECVDNLKDSMAVHRDKLDCSLVEACIFKCDLDGNSDLVETLDLTAPGASVYKTVVA